MNIYICKSCNKEHTPNRNGGSSLKCSTCYTKEKRIVIKNKIIEYLGAKCQNCNFDACKSALELHHVNPLEKEFTIAGKHCHAWSKIKKEIEKCVLLCANCHRIFHHDCIENGCKENCYINFELKQYNIPDKSPITSYEKDGRSLKPDYNRRNNKYGSRNDYNNAIKQNNLQNNLSKVKEILESGIDFSKLGWKTKVSKIIKIKPQKVSGWIKINIPELLEKSFNRNSPIK